MISYIQAIDVIRAFAIQHLQVKKFNYEFKEQMQNLATLNEAYPFLYVVPIGASVQEFTNEFDLDIYCVDRLQKDRTNTSFIVSDTQQILADLTLWLEQGQNDIEVIQNYAMTPINNDLLDYVSGWVMRVRIQVTRIGLCEIPFGGESPTPPTCPSGIVKNSDDTYKEIVPSGGTLVLDDITVTDSDGTEIQVPAQTDFVCIPCDPPTEIDVYINRELVAENATEDVLLILQDQDQNLLTFTQVDDTLTVNIPPCQDATLTLNGNQAFFHVPSGDVQNLELLDQNGDPITPDDVTGNVITVDVGEPCPPITSSAKPLKTALTTSYATGDDGDTQRGRATDFLTLDFINPFGNNRRFTGLTGGYHDGTTYRLVDGTASTRAGAFPNDICADWTTFQNNEVLLYYHGDANFRGRNAHIAQYLTGTISGLTGWYVVNRQELFRLMNDQAYLNSTHFLAYPPFDYTGGLRRYIWISSGSAAVGVTTDFGVIHAFSSGNANNALNSIWCRYTTLTELGL